KNIIVRTMRPRLVRQKLSQEQNYWSSLAAHKSQNIVSRSEGRRSSTTYSSKEVEASYCQWAAYYTVQEQARMSMPRHIFQCDQTDEDIQDEQYTEDIERYGPDGGERFAEHKALPILPATRGYRICVAHRKDGSPSVDPSYMRRGARGKFAVRQQPRVHGPSSFQ